jgi:hypothetical protein
MLFIFVGSSDTEFDTSLSLRPQYSKHVFSIVSAFIRSFVGLHSLSQFRDRKNFAELKADGRNKHRSLLRLTGTTQHLGNWSA